MLEGRCAPLHAKQGRDQSIKVGLVACDSRSPGPSCRSVGPPTGISTSMRVPPCYQPSVTWMIVLPGTRGASGPNAGGRFGKGPNGDHVGGQPAVAQPLR